MHVIMKSFIVEISTLHLLLGLLKILATEFDDGLRGNYCRWRYPVQCCSDRDDTCTAPILDTLCYCDMFCARRQEADCCPDFFEVCFGISPFPPPPSPVIRLECRHEGEVYTYGETMKPNCNLCTCVSKEPGSSVGKFDCEQNVCLMRPDLINVININYDNLGWRADNYSAFWGKTLHEGIRHRLGTFKPTVQTMQMTELHMITNGPLPESFDSRERWRGLIQPIKDQRDCASSWAFSTTALASDRLAIQSLGTEVLALSPQQLLSCQNRGQRACEGGHLDKAWYYLRKTGVTTEDCFPYASGKNGEKIQCPFKIPVGSESKKVVCPNGEEGMLYHSTPPYRVGPKEEEIMREIFYNGPVQATFRVHEDFFSYKSGVYRYSQMSSFLHQDAFTEEGWHSVRIIGWGTEIIDERPVKFWLCANSWGPWWGESGYFRIVRGENECDIEMFIIGVWGNTDDNMLHTV